MHTFNIKYYRFVLNPLETITNNLIAEYKKVEYKEEQFVGSLEHLFKKIEKYLDNHYGYVNINRSNMIISNRSKLIKEMLFNHVKIEDARMKENIEEYVRHLKEYKEGSCVQCFKLATFDDFYNLDNSRICQKCFSFNFANDFNGLG